MRLVQLAKDGALGQVDQRPRHVADADLTKQVKYLATQVADLHRQIAAMRAKEDTYLCQICMECPIDTM
eukprot:SAG31_NODE_37894_length_300_cov_1.034826_1_plen_68_part_10